MKKMHELKRFGLSEILDVKYNILQSQEVMAAQSCTDPIHVFLESRKSKRP